MKITIALLFIMLGLNCLAQTNGITLPYTPSPANQAADSKIASDAAQLIFDILARFNLTGIFTTLAGIGGSGFMLYWTSKGLRNKFPKLAGTWFGWFLSQVINLEAAKLQPPSPPAGTPKQQEQAKV